jgi:hypothetical protein
MRLSIARTVAATTVSAGFQWKAAGTISPTIRLPLDPARLDVRKHVSEAPDNHSSGRTREQARPERMRCLSRASKHDNTRRRKEKEEGEGSGHPGRHDP